MNIGDQEYLICEKHNAFSYQASDKCADCKVEKLEAENANLKRLLVCVETNLSKGMSKSIQKLQAKTIREVRCAMKGEA